MPEIGLDRAQQSGLVGGSAPSDYAAQRVGLDRVTQDGPGSVCLDVVDGAGIDAGVLVGAAQYVGLGVGVGCQQAVGAAVVVDRRSRDDSDDLVAVPTGVREPLEHQHPAALRAGVPVGVGGKGFDPAIGGEHTTDLVEPQSDRGRDERVDASGDDDVRLTGAQCLDALVHGDQRGRTRGVDGYRRAAEVEEVGHPVGDDGACRTRDRIGMCGTGVHHRQVAVVVGGTADEDAHAAAPQARRRDARVLQGLPCQFERHPLLRIEVVGLHFRQREELGVETLEVAQVAAPGTSLGDPLGQSGLLGELRPAAVG